MAAPRTGRPSEANSRINGPRGSGKKYFPANWHLVAAVLAATFIAYAHTLSYQFVYDDHPWLEDNPALHSWRYIGDYFTKHLWSGVGPYVLGNYYRPVFMIWSRINVWVFGVDPLGYHLGAVLLHVLVTLLVFLLTLRISSNRNHAALASLIFGLHPVHIESVAWILGSTDSLAGVFMISSFLCWAEGNHPSPGSKRWRMASWVLFGLGLLAKEIVLILPMLVMVHDYVVHKSEVDDGMRGVRLQKLRHSVLAISPFLIIVIPYLALRVWVLQGFSHPVVKALPWQAIPFAWPELFWFYLRHLTWPVGLTTYYDLPAPVPPGWENFGLPLLGSVAVILLLGCGAVKSKVIRLGTAWLIIPLLPALDLRVFSRDDLAHDRFLYVASIGFAIIASYLIHCLPPGTARIFGYSARKTFLTLALAGSLGWGTVVESAYFRNDWTFLNHIYTAAPRNLYTTLALGRYWRARGQYAESAKLMESCIRDHPEDWDATYSLGRDEYKLGRFREAIGVLTRASLLDPAAPGPYLDLGLCWIQLGEYDRAEASFREALILQPDGYGYHFALGVAMMKRGERAPALEEFKAELRLYPDNEAAKAQIAQMSRGETQAGP